MGAEGNKFFDEELIALRHEIGEEVYTKLYHKCLNNSKSIMKSNRRASGLVYDNPPEKLERIRVLYRDKDFMKKKIAEMVGNWGVSEEWICSTKISR